MYRVYRDRAIVQSIEPHHYILSNETNDFYI